MDTWFATCLQQCLQRDNPNCEFTISEATTGSYAMVRMCKPDRKTYIAHVMFQPDHVQVHLSSYALPVCDKQNTLLFVPYEAADWYQQINTFIQRVL